MDRKLFGPGLILVVLLLCTSDSQTLAAQTTLTPEASARGASAEMIEALKLYRTGRFDDAIAKYQSALQQDPKSGEAYAGLSRCLLKEEKIPEALDAANKGVSVA